jgi:hypothetical protein
LDERNVDNWGRVNCKNSMEHLSGMLSNTEETSGHNYVLFVISNLLYQADARDTTRHQCQQLGPLMKCYRHL